MTYYPLNDEKQHTVDLEEEENLLLKHPTKRHKEINISLKTIDIILASTFLCFLVVSCWRGTWGLLDIYGKYFPIYESFFLSIFCYTILALCQDFFNEMILEAAATNLFNKTINFIFIKTYVLFLHILTIMHWRSSWQLYDDLIEVMHNLGVKMNFWDGDSHVYSIMQCLLAIVVTAWIRGIINVNATPMDINADVKEETFIMDLNFFKMGERTSLYILDCLFSILIVGTLVVFVWRGVWELIDIFLFPDDEAFSAWSSLLLGYFIVAIAFLLQPLMRYLCERLTGTARLLVADLFILFALFGTVNVWRGIWNLLNIYFLPDNQELSCWITHWVSLIILMLCRCSNSLLVRGVYIDAEEPAGKCAVFPCYYLRVIFRKKKLKKLNLAVFTINDSIKVNHKDNEVATNNHVVNINTISNTVEDNSGSKPSVK